ncbi:unnamed protein product, partial [Amoebophrya sp. A120]|eukprot:GSA120T00025493001.1
MKEYRLAVWARASKVVQNLSTARAGVRCELCSAPKIINAHFCAINHEKASLSSATTNSSTQLPAKNYSAADMCVAGSARLDGKRGTNCASTW